MTGMSWARLHGLADAASLVQTGAALLVVALTRGTALDAIGIVFAVPILSAAIARIMRRSYFALTGRTLSASLQAEQPPARLGRAKWERGPNARCG